MGSWRVFILSCLFFGKNQPLNGIMVYIFTFYEILRVSFFNTHLISFLQTVQDCGVPPALPHTTLTYTDTVYTSNATYRCLRGHDVSEVILHKGHLPSSPSIQEVVYHEQFIAQCTAAGAWHVPHPEGCKGE